MLVIIFDLLLPRRIHGLLPYLAFLMLAGPFVLSLVQFYDLGLAANLVRDGEGTGEASILLGSLSVDRFALFFNFLVTGAVGLVEGVAVRCSQAPSPTLLVAETRTRYCVPLVSPVMVVDVLAALCVDEVHVEPSEVYRTR